MKKRLADTNFDADAIIKDIPSIYNSKIIDVTSWTVDMMGRYLLDPHGHMSMFMIEKLAKFIYSTQSSYDPKWTAIEHQSVSPSTIHIFARVSTQGQGSRFFKSLRHPFQDCMRRLEFLGISTENLQVYVEIVSSRKVKMEGRPQLQQMLGVERTMIWLFAEDPVLLREVKKDLSELLKYFKYWIALYVHSRNCGFIPLTGPAAKDTGNLHSILQYYELFLAFTKEVSYYTSQSVIFRSQLSCSADVQETGNEKVAKTCKMENCDNAPQRSYGDFCSLDCYREFCKKFNVGIRKCIRDGCHDSKWPRWHSLFNPLQRQ